MTPDPGTTEDITEASPEDVAEQRAAVTDDALEAAALPDDASVDVPLDLPLDVPDDVPYADAVEQAQSVPDDEDGPRE